MKIGIATVAVIGVVAIGGCGEGLRVDGRDAALQGDGRPLATQTREPVDRSIRTFLDGALPEGPGGTVVAARDGGLVHCRGFGLADREKKIPARCDTVYDIMSMTKQFTAAAVMKLEMTGRLRVSDPIGAHLDGVPADKRGITLHHLLTHTAGLDDEGAGGDDYDPVSRDRMLEVALRSGLRSAPGAEFHYSNLGYSVLAAIIEKVSGVGYERFLAEHLFKPSGMTRTGYVLPRWKRDEVAVEYDERGVPQGRPYEHPWAADGPYWFLRGNGGLLSTPRDMFRWHRALAGNGVLSRRAKREMFTPHVFVGAADGIEMHYGYGWGVVRANGRVINEHDGGNDWSFGEFARFPDHRVMVFWISNHALREGEWNLVERNKELTFGIERHARD
ncbi:CubicO group peptidase (beta-lactamase class C family) [Actinomadura pelletieri DSM 43383]|uniref:CubicO group peptidase (Beta-lactamase class C family) n=1 Tax=Actinomadura pelletieri DSM 43383 TaxID=1120940 RepID=A0A495QU58_9ACTN|nr:serine hydrolase domain-containing protein [Actinomadura pelletieri]RKS77019.1 CubicO group peptidase (beta-lactamase class C family) [Actinomadura pelletieri DSM 43383]